MKILAVLVLFALAAGAAMAQTPAPAPSPAPDSPAGKQLIEGRQVIVAAYAPLAEKYSQVHAAMQNAGGASPAGLNTREDIAARKALLDACLAANDDILKFFATEPETLRAELAKVSMPPPKIDEYAANFTPDPATPQLVSFRLLARQTFKDMSDSLTVLDETFGRWKLGEGGRITFKKAADSKKYGAVIERVRKSIAAQTAAQGQFKGQRSGKPRRASPWRVGAGRGGDGDSGHEGTVKNGA